MGDRTRLHLVSHRRARALAGFLLLALAVPLGAASNSARYRFEGNKWLSLDLAVREVRAEVIRFEWPATLMRVKTGYKATIKIVNGSSHQVGAGVGVAVYDDDGSLLGAGTSGTTLGTIDPGDSANFTVSFEHVTERLEQAEQFQIVLEIR